MFISTDNVSTWTALGLSSNYVMTLAIKDSNIFAGTDAGMFLSTNNGANWIAINNGLPVNTNVYSLAISGSNIFAGTQAGGVYLSSNNGSTWTYLGLSGADIRSLAIIGSDIFVGTYGNGVFLSTNNGVNWIATNTGIPLNANVYAFATSGNNFFAGTIGNGVYLSTDNGSTWTSVNAGLTDTNVYSLAITGGELYAGTREAGVWKRPLSDILPPDTIKTFANPTNGGAISGSGIYNYNQSCTVKATSNTGYIFINWKENGNIVSIDTSYTFIATANRNLIANFTSTQGMNNNNLNESFYIYPNPAKYNLTIETNSNTEQKIEIQNLIGQTVYTMYINKKATINTSAFANGIYIFKLSSDKATLVKKFVKE